MPSAAAQDQMRVIIAPDASRAELYIPPKCSKEAVTPKTCLALLQAEGVEITPAVEQAVQELLAKYDGTALRGVVAQATPAQDGQDGRIDWTIDREIQQRDEQAKSYYERCAFIMVKAGQVLGRVIPPTSGQDGRNVLGQTIPAKPGKPASFRVNESVLVDAEGRIIAQTEGALIREGEKIFIRQALQIPGYVDFSTGNLDFTGDIQINKGIRDLFVVKATGNVEVGGLIEAATVECGGNLLARGGFAGRTRGTARVGGNLIARYLDNVQGEIKGDLIVDREVINCDLVVHGSVRSPQGLIIGGRILVVGRCEVAVLGSPACVTTDLILGAVPDLEAAIAKLEGILDQARQRLNTLEEERKRLGSDRRLRSAADKERLTELMFTIQSLEAKVRQAEGTLEAMRQWLQTRRTVDLMIHKTLHLGVRLIIGDQIFQIVTDVRGPLRIFRDEHNEYVYRPANGVGGLLVQIAEVKMRDGRKAEPLVSRPTPARAG